MTGVQEVNGQWECWLDGRVIATRPTYTRAVDALVSIGFWNYGLSKEQLQAKVRATQAAAVEVVKTHKPRCPHYKAIRRAFAIATEQGLDTKADVEMRAAFGRCLHRDVPSREVLNGRDWMLLGDAMKRRQLAW
jgi:hypothetical protein